MFQWGRGGVAMVHFFHWEFKFTNLTRLTIFKRFKAQCLQVSQPQQLGTCQSVPKSKDIFKPKPKENGRLADSFSGSPVTDLRSVAPQMQNRVLTAVVRVARLIIYLSLVGFNWSYSGDVGYV